MPATSDQANGLLDLVRILAWPALILYLSTQFRDAITALLKPPESGQSTVKIGTGGIEITRIASSVASVAVAAGVQAGKEGTDASQEQIAGSISHAVATSLGLAPKQTIARRILWVDDNPPNNMLLAKSFRDLGIEVTEARSTDDAVKLLEGNQKFGLIITDMSRQLDREAGLILLKCLRERNIGLPTIIYAARWAQQNKGREQELGVALITNNPSAVYAFVLRTLTSDVSVHIS
jgi:CheY-like chemotaxis protein